MFDVAELRANGYQPEQLGLVRVGDHDQAFEMPQARVDVDMKSRYDIDLYKDDDTNLDHPTMIIGGVFEDPHPDDWWERVHRHGDLVLLAGDTPPSRTRWR